MTATSATPTSALAYELTPAATVTIETLDTDVRLRAVDGRTALVRLVGGDTTSAFRIWSTADRLEIRPIKRWPFGWSRIPGPLEVDVPRDARVDVKTASGTIVGSDVIAASAFRTASGDVELTGAGGNVDVSTMSGGIRIAGSSTIALMASSVSGRIDVTSPALSALNGRSMSGSIRLLASFQGSGPFGLETVSGEVTVGTDAPIRLMPSTISGEVRSDVGWPRDRTAVGGGTGPEVRVRTISGRIRLVPWSPGPRPTPSSSIATPPSHPAASPVTGPMPETTPSTDAHRSDAHRSDAGPAAAAADEDARLTILRALARGEMTVAEAAVRIDALEATPDE